MIGKFIFYLVAATLWYVIYLTGRTTVKRFRVRRYLTGAWFAALMILPLWAGLELGMVPGSGVYRDCYYSKQWFGRIEMMGAPRLSYDSERDFNGDGYSIEVFDISNSFAAWAASPPADFTTHYPIKPGFRSDWNSTTWHKTPIPEEERGCLTFAMSEDADDPKLKIAIRLLEKLAKESGNYIAVRYKGDAVSVGNVDLFLLSPSAKTFILVNHNT